MPSVLYFELAYEAASLEYVYLNHAFRFWNANTFATNAPLSDMATPMLRMSVSYALPSHTLTAAVTPTMAMKPPMKCLGFMANLID